VLAGPAAGLPGRWDADAAADALAAIGWPHRNVHRAVSAATHGEALAPLLGGDETPVIRAIAVECGPLLAPALAWALAKNEEATTAKARALLRWWRKFAAAGPLLSGEEIAELRQLPAGPARAEAVRSLRLAQARGEVRTRRQARNWLLGGN
jgi:hypothetical protein